MKRMEWTDQNSSMRIGNVAGDLRVRGWERPEVAVQDETGTLATTEDGQIEARSMGDLVLRVPMEVPLEGRNVSGDAKIGDLCGRLSLENVGGDLLLRDAGPTDVTRIGGDVRVKRADGSVTLGMVGGDATIREVSGDTTIAQVGGDLYVRDIGGGCQVEHVGSDLVLSTNFIPGAAYRFDVGGDIVCRIPAGASVRFQTAHSHDLVVDAPGAQMVEGEDGDEVVFGAGEAVVRLEAGGEIRLVGQDEDYMMAINFQLEGELAERLAGLEERLAEQLSGLDDLILRKTEKVRERAEKEAERAVRHAERMARKAERGKRKGFTFSFGGDSFEAGLSRRPARAPRPPAPPAEPVSDEERMTILRMVENRQISVEEAEKLLAALEGRRSG